jgi:hypothetical protein
VIETRERRGFVNLMRKVRMNLVSFGSALAIVFAILSNSTSVQALSDGGFTYVISGGNVTVTGCAAACPADLMIPATLAGGTVTTVGGGSYGFAFRSFDSVTLPNTLKAISNYAFEGSRFTALVIPDSVETIGTAAFEGNRSLTSLNLGISVKSIAGTAFANAFDTRAGAALVIPPSVTSIGGEAFVGNGLTSVSIPSSITRIEQGVFSGNALTAVAIPSSVTFIGSSSFSDNALTAVTIPSSVTFIDSEAFEDNALTSVAIPSSVTVLKRNTFANNALVSITLPASLTSIEAGVFSGNFLTEVTIPPLVTAIGDYAFYGNSLAAVTIPSTVTTIGREAFSNNALTSVTIPASVTRLEPGVFAGNALTSVAIPSSVTFIGDAALRDNALTSVAIPSSVTYIGHYAFAGNTLTAANLPDSITSAGNYAFAFNNISSVTISSALAVLPYALFEGNSLVSLEIPSSVTTISDRVFMDNTLTSVTIPSSVASIGNQAFSGNALVSLTIPSSVTTVGAHAFEANALVSVRFLGNAPALKVGCVPVASCASSRFAGNDGLKKILRPEMASGWGTTWGGKPTAMAFGAYTYHGSGGAGAVGITGCLDACPIDLVIPATLDGREVTWIGNSSFLNNALTSVSIPSSVASIGDYAFYGNSLAAVTIPSSVSWIGPSAFSNNALTSVTMPSSVTGIAGSAFSNNVLTSVTIPSSVTWIGPSAFSNNALTSVTIPASVTRIEYRAFSSNALTSVTFLGNAPTAGTEVFLDNFGLAQVQRPFRATGWGSTWSGIAVVDSRKTQTITFSAVSDRTTLQALSFDVAPTASSGLLVTLAASGSCEVSGFTVSVTDKGNCTLTAQQTGADDWLQAPPVVRSFSVSRVLLSNKTITVRDTAGTAVPGVKVSWRTPDGTFNSTGVMTTNSAGNIVFSRIATGKVEFTVVGKAGLWDTGASIFTLFVGSATSTITIGPDLADRPLLVRVKVLFDDGTPVPGAAVSVQGASPTGGQFQATCATANQWYLRTCDVSGVTDTDGFAQLVLPGSKASAQVYARFSDFDLVQTSGNVTVGVDGAPQIILETLPVVVLETEAVTLNYGAAQTVTATARDSDGSPIAGRSLTLSASTSGASASCSGRKTTATTNSSGRATFKVCPVKTATWSVDGRSIVGSKGVRLTVQLTPTAPRTLVATAKTRSVSLAWVAPVKANASAVTDYIVQYRLQGSSTWITFRDGTSTSRRATVTGLVKGRVYEFRIAAKNRSGTGSWSVVVLRAAN